jgi:flagellar motor switch protein FliM
MSDEQLSQAELKSLLNAVQSEVGPGPVASTVDLEDKGPVANNQKRQPVVPYLFADSEPIDRQLLCLLQTIHRRFCVDFTSALSAMLRCQVELKLTDVDQLSYAEYVANTESPTYLNLLKVSPLDRNFLLDIALPILFPIIDRLLGGLGEESVGHCRSLTEVERRLTSRVTNLLLEKLAEAWKSVFDLRFESLRTESDPDMAEIASGTDRVIKIGLEFGMGEVRGKINIVLPTVALAPVTEKISATENDPTAKTASQESRDRIGQVLESSEVELEVLLAQTRISTADLLELSVGDIITTEHDSRSPLSVNIENRSKFTASAGQYKGHKAIRIENHIE